MYILGFFNNNSNDNESETEFEFGISSVVATQSNSFSRMNFGFKPNTYTSTYTTSSVTTYK